MPADPNPGPQVRCPSDDTITAFVQAELASEAREQIARHIDDCEACLARLADAGLAVEPTTAAEPPPGGARRVGRYELRRLLGMGGMGLVYEAYDPDLQRSVAIKVLRPDDRGGPIREDRLVQEARALARLSHRNIVQVYDAGTRGGDVFLCMELIAGRNLRDAMEPRPAWREIVRTFIAIGRGLCAAHAAGIVHRDVKPENVLIADDGRILVSDFGLARSAYQTSASSPASAADAPPAHRITAFAGTPAYMAPEQLAGTSADARSDQFSFCVALVEALSGARPPDPTGATDQGRRAALTATIKSARVPGRLAKAIGRGLAIAPAQRFPRLDQLVAELERAHSRRRTVRIAAAASALALAGAGIAVTTLTRGRDEPSACERDTRRMARIWPAQRDALVGALARALPTTTPGPSDFPLGVEQQVDKIAAAWSRAHSENCRALEAAGAAASAHARAEQLCLEEWLLQLENYLQLAIRDSSVAINAMALAREVGLRQRCRIQLTGDPAADTRMMSLWGALGALTLERQSAGATAVLDRARRLLPEARAVGDPALEAEWLAFIGDLERLGDPAAASATLLAAVQAADRARRDDVRVHAMIGLSAIAIMTNHLDDAERWAAQAEGALARDAARWEDRPGAPGRGADDLLEAPLRNLQGVIAGLRSHPEQAIRQASRALELWQRAGHPNAVGAHNTIAEQLNRLGDTAGALEHLRQAVQLGERELGPLHPFLALTLVNLGASLSDANRAPEAIPLLERASSILDAIQAKAQLPQALVVLAAAYRRVGDAPRATATAERCVAVATDALGSHHEMTARCTGELGLGRERQGDAAGALPSLERTLELLRDAATRDGVVVRAHVSAAVARALWSRARREDRVRARTLAAAAERDFQSTGAGDDVEHRDFASWRQRSGL